MRTTLLLAMGVLCLAALLIGCGKNQPQAAPVGADGKPIAQKLCPVMGDPINPNIYVDYNGRRVYFCCTMCPPKFKAEPEKYLKILDEQMKKDAEPAQP